MQREEMRELIQIGSELTDRLRKELEEVNAEIFGVFPPEKAAEFFEMWYYEAQDYLCEINWVLINLFFALLDESEEDEE